MMILNERNATPQSTTSEDSVPLAKRRRIETSADAEPDNGVPPSTSSSQGGNIDDMLRVDQAEVHAHLQEPKVIEDLKQSFSLHVLPKTVIAIECGKDLGAHYHVPLSVFCAQSQKQLEVFWQAEDLHMRYAKVKALKKRVKDMHPLLELHDIKPTEKSREKAFALILECLDDFPIAMYQAGIAQKLTEVTDAMFQKNDMFIKTSPKKGDRLQYPRNNVEGRLRQLRDEAVYTVLERLNLYLNGLKHMEQKNASGAAIKAAAQRRVLLPDEDPATVEVLVGWLYNDGLSFTDVKHLYRIHALADKLGIERLAAECMELLTTATSRILTQAKSEGVTLKDLLNESARGHKQTQDLHMNQEPLSSLHVVGEVFKVTLKTPTPPAVLQNLVADAIADSEDDELFDQLLPVMNLDMRGKIAIKMIRNAKVRAAAAGAKQEIGYSHTYSEASRSASIKSEVEHAQDQDVKQECAAADGPRNKAGTSAGCNENVDRTAAN